MSKKNYGSIKPLNWVDPLPDEKAAIKSIPHKERIESYYRAGTPPTRRGAFHGHKPLFSPPLDSTDVGPSLYIDKAVRMPVKYGPGGKPQFQRKRDASGKFAPEQQVGAQSTAEEDSDKLEREARLRAARNKESLRQTKMRAQEAKKGMDGSSTSVKLPGMNEAEASLSGSDDSYSNQIGSTNSGLPVFDDPYHSSHEEFSPADHQEAADLNNMLAQQYQSSGDMRSATKYQNNASVHNDMVNESSPPGDRFLDNLLNQQSQGQEGMAPDQQSPGAGEITPDMNQFSDPLGTDPQFDPSGLSNFVSPAPPSSSLDSAPPPGQEDPMSAFTDPNSVDQNKPLGGGMNEGPKPNMVDNRTGEPTGPQTEVGQASNPMNQGEQSPTPDSMGQGAEDQPPIDGFSPGQDPMGPEQDADTQVIDLDEMLGDEEFESEDSTPQDDDGEDQESVPDSHAGAPGPTSEFDRGSFSEDEESDDDTLKALNKAISALRKYYV